MHKLRRDLCWFLALALLVGMPGKSQTPPVPLVLAYNTYEDPPFVDGPNGLAPDLIAYLNEKLAGEYRFQLVTIPRSRFTRLILADRDSFGGIALFLNPRFIDDADQKRFFWTAALCKDANVLVFRGPTAPPIRSLSDLEGLRFGSALDNFHKGIDQLVARNEVVRVNTYSTINTLRQISRNAIDFTELNATAFHLLSQSSEFAGKFVSTQVPGEPPFTRHILIGKQNPALAARLARLVQAMPSDPGWAVLTKRYGLKPAMP